VCASISALRISCSTEEVVGDNLFALPAPGGILAATL
jgi:hypothetical protein